MLKFTLTINDQESRGANFSFRDNKKEMRFLLYKKDQYATNPEMKFKEYMDLMVRPLDSDGTGVKKEVVFDTEFTFEAKQVFVLKGKYVFELGDENTHKDLINLYATQYKYRN